MTQCRPHKSRGQEPSIASKNLTEKYQQEPKGVNSLMRAARIFSVASLPLTQTRSEEYVAETGIIKRENKNVQLCGCASIH